MDKIGVSQVTRTISLPKLTAVAEEGLTSVGTNGFLYLATVKM